MHMTYTHILSIWVCLVSNFLRLQFNRDVLHYYVYSSHPPESSCTHALGYTHNNGWKLNLIQSMTPSQLTKPYLMWQILRSNTLWKCSNKTKLHRAVL